MFGPPLGRIWRSRSKVKVQGHQGQKTAFCWPFWRPECSLCLVKHLQPLLLCLSRFYFLDVFKFFYIDVSKSVALIKSDWIGVFDCRSGVWSAVCPSCLSYSQQREALRDNLHRVINSRVPPANTLNRHLRVLQLQNAIIILLLSPLLDTCRRPF